MLRPSDNIEIKSNFEALMTCRGKYVRGTRREGHNVFTTTGRDWLAHLCAWSTVGSPDVPYTNRRLRWIGVGTGTQAEVAGVTSLDSPSQFVAGQYLAALQSSDFPALKEVRVIKEFNQSEISFPGQLVVPVTEAGLFVDLFPVSTLGGVEDAAVGGGDTTLNTALAANAPVAYKTFEVINKTSDFNLEVRWKFSF